MIEHIGPSLSSFLVFELTVSPRVEDIMGISEVCIDRDELFQCCGNWNHIIRLNGVPCGGTIGFDEDRISVHRSIEKSGIALIAERIVIA